jgi:uncharacterized membrane protein YjjP (DUF1212 family)
MVLHTRPIAFSIAIAGFFALSIVGTITGLAPDTCCERALLGAAVTYLVASVALKAINAILTQAMIASHVNKDNAGDNQN